MLRANDLHGLLNNSARAHPHNLAVLDSDGNTLTYFELSERVNAFVLDLQQAG